MALNPENNDNFMEMEKQILNKFFNTSEIFLSSNYEIKEEKCNLNFIFQIKDFSSLKLKNGEYIESSSYKMKDCKEKPLYCRLKVYPKGDKAENEKYLSLHLDIMVHASYQVGILTSYFEDPKIDSKECIVDGNNNSLKWSKFMKTSELEKIDSILYNNVLIILCSIKGDFSFGERANDSPKIISINENINEDSFESEDEILNQNCCESRKKLFEADNTFAQYDKDSDTYILQLLESTIRAATNNIKASQDTNSVLPKIFN